uniref:choice-of-anchor Q domain-containing protein n=1 Tax=Actinotalea caeni TaxID=1348467 RepID=UPI0012E32861
MRGYTLSRHARTGTTRTRRTRRLAGGLVAVAAVALGTAALPAPAIAADTTWFVDQTSTHPDEDCGATAETACSTITAALARAEATDTISVAPGTYSESVEITQAITLQGPSADDVTIVGAGPTDPVVTVGASGVAITNLTIGLPAADEPGGEEAAVGVRVLEGNGVDLEGVVVEGPYVSGDLSGYGIVAEQGSTVAIDQSTLSGLGMSVLVGGDLIGDLPATAATLSMTATTIRDGLVGIYVLLGDVTVSDSEISDQGMSAIIGGLPGTTIDVTDTELLRNADWDQDSFRSAVLLRGPVPFTGTRLTIADNERGLLAEAGGQVTLIDSTLDNNGKQESGTGGYAIAGRTEGDHAEPLLLRLENTQVTNNWLGVVVGGEATVEIIGSTVADSSYEGLRDVPEDDSAIDLTITDSTFSRNGLAPDDEFGAVGPSVSVTDGTVTVSGSTISEGGYGLRMGAGTLTVDDSEISGNELAGIHLWGNPENGPLTATLTGTTISGNGFGNLGLVPQTPFLAGIVARSATVEGDGVTLAENAWGVMLQAGELTLTESTVVDSAARTTGDELDLMTGVGILSLPDEDETVNDITLVRSEVSGNERHGIWLPTADELLVDRSTIADNGEVGLLVGGLPGVQGRPVPMLLAGSTVAGNGISGIDLMAGPTLTVAGSVIDGGDGAACVVADPEGVVDGGANVISDDTCELVDGVVADPQLGALTDNGGPTMTALPAATSPAIDLVPTGTSATFGGTELELCPGDVDQRGEGFLRLAGDGCDAGAVERERGLVTVTASDATWYEGAFDPEVTPSYSGFRDGDSEADVDTPPTCGFDVDTATTFCSGAEDDVYDFVYVDGTLDVLEPLVILTESLPEATVGEPYSATLEATGGDGGPYTWGIHDGALPAGLEIDTTTGEIFGVPEAAGDVTFTVFVGDPITRELTLTVLPAAEEPEPPVDDPTEDPTDDPTE